MFKIIPLLVVLTSPGPLLGVVGGAGVVVVPCGPPRLLGDSLRDDFGGGGLTTPCFLAGALSFLLGRRGGCVRN